MALIPSNLPACVKTRCYLSIQGGFSTTGASFQRRYEVQGMPYIEKRAGIGGGCDAQKHSGRRAELRGAGE